MKITVDSSFSVPFGPIHCQQPRCIEHTPVLMVPSAHLLRPSTHLFVPGTEKEEGAKANQCNQHNPNSNCNQHCVEQNKNDINSNSPVEALLQSMGKNNAATPPKSLSAAVVSAALPFGRDDLLLSTSTSSAPHWRMAAVNESLASLANNLLQKERKLF